MIQVLICGRILQFGRRRVASNCSLFPAAATASLLLLPVSARGAETILYTRISFIFLLIAVIFMQRM
jgi:hypothetical protein